MTSETVQVDLEAALTSIFSQAEQNMGFRFHKVASELPDQQAYMVKDVANEKLLGIVKLDPYTSRSTSCSANSADDRTVSVISVSMNLAKSDAGDTPKLNAQELHTLFKLSGHAFSALASKKHQKGFKIHPDFVELKPSV